MKNTIKILCLIIFTTFSLSSFGGGPLAIPPARPGMVRELPERQGTPAGVGGYNTSGFNPGMGQWSESKTAGPAAIQPQQKTVGNSTYSQTTQKTMTREEFLKGLKNSGYPPTRSTTPASVRKGVKNVLTNQQKYNSNSPSGEKVLPVAPIQPINPKPFRLPVSPSMDVKQKQEFINSGAITCPSACVITQAGKNLLNSNPSTEYSRQFKDFVQRNNLK